jgi:hypothetical protein
MKSFRVVRDVRLKLIENPSSTLLRTQTNPTSELPVILRLFPFSQFNFLFIINRAKEMTKS